MGDENYTQLFHKMANYLYLNGFGYIIFLVWALSTAYSPYIITTQNIFAIGGFLENLLVIFIIIQAHRLKKSMHQPETAQFYKYMNLGFVFTMLYFIIFFIVFFIMFDQIMGYSEFICDPPIDDTYCFEQQEWLIAFSPKIIGFTFYCLGLGCYYNAWMEFKKVIVKNYGNRLGVRIYFELNSLKIIGVAYLLDIAPFFTTMGTWASLFIFVINPIVVMLSIILHIGGFLEAGNFLKQLIHSEVEPRQSVQNYSLNYCHRCGHIVSKNQAFCAMCGAKMNNI